MRRLRADPGGNRGAANDDTRLRPGISAESLDEMARAMIPTLIRIADHHRARGLEPPSWDNTRGLCWQDDDGEWYCYACNVDRRLHDVDACV